MLLFLCLIFFQNVCDIFCLEKTAEENIMGLLPNIFEMDEYEKCSPETEKYCEIKIVLKPLNLNNNNSFIWKSIEDTKYSSKHYDHKLLYYRKCINNNSSDIMKYYNENFQRLGLRGSIEKINCQETISHPTGIYDTLFMTTLCSYILFIFYITYLDYYNSKYSEVKKGLNDVLVAFSLRGNFRKVFETNRFPSKTKFIQGVRVIVMLLIILTHTSLHILNSYIKNTDFVENVFLSPICNRLMMLTLYLVQIFFIISAFLLSVQVHEIYERHKHFSFKYLCILLMNRYFRLIPTMVVVVGLSRFWPLVKYFAHKKDGVIHDQFNACLNNWLPTLLLYNNEIIGKNVCLPGTWYVSADTQLYLIALVLFYIKFKFNFKLRPTIGILVIISVVWQGLIIFAKNLNFVYKLTPQHNLLNKMLLSSTFWGVYTSTITNVPSYMIGIYLGYFYFKNRNNIVSKPNNKSTLCWIICINILVTVCEISNKELSTVLSIIVGPVLKPFFGIGIGIMIMTMINYEGMFKSICESNLLQIISTITYTTYNAHFIVIFSRYFQNLIHLSSYNVVTTYLEDAALSMIFGLLLHLIVELPLQNLQKKIIPQLPKKIHENYEINHNKSI